MRSHIWRVSGKVFVVIVSTEEQNQGTIDGPHTEGPLGIKHELAGGLRRTFLRKKVAKCQHLRKLQSD